ncbi:MAG: EAL domain-containing protein [Sulfuricella sp.]|nr:EAL domain-containing protein [Sulfuricella sp.]
MIAGVVALHAILMGLVVWDMVVRQQTFMQVQIAAEGLSLSRTLAANAPSWLLSNDLNGLGEIVETLKTAKNVRLAMVLDAQGKVRASTDGSLFNLVLDDSASRQLLGALHGGSADQQLWHDGMVDSVAEIRSGNQPIGYARVLIDAEPVQHELQAVTRQGMLYTVAAILLGGLIAWLLVRTITRRLALLSHAADQIAAGNLAVSLPSTLGRDEVSRLTHDFAAMVHALEKDIAERDHIEAELFEEKERAQVTLNSIGDAVITTDVAGNVTFLNPVAENMTGWNNDEAQGKPLEEIFRIINDTTRKTVENPVMRALRENRIVGLANHTVLIRRDGKELHIEDSAAPIRNRDGSILGVILVFNDVSEKYMLSLQLSYQARHDNLTGLVNRSEFELRLAEMIHATGAFNRSHALLYIDLDQFKVINDTCGHSAGDHLLRELSNLLKEKVRGSDTLARLGGDEFGLLLANCPPHKALAIAQEMLETIKAFRFEWEENTFSIGASIGLVEITESSGSAVRLLSAADTACYAAKDSGRNRVQVYQPDDVEMARRHGEMHWVARIARAFEEERFILYHQPIVPLNGAEEEEHFEILIRLLDENGKITPPNSFIPAAERYNLMRSVDRWVVAHTFNWLVANPTRNVVCSINLSGQSIGDEQFLHYLFNQFKGTGVAPQRVCFEITETAAIANLGKATDFIGELKAIGCRFSLDDFGSGLSSFSYLKNLPVDYLKIDGIFVKDMAHVGVDYAMVEAINNVGHVMGIKTIAEYVENDAILEKLRAIGVDYAQGFGIAMPAPLVELPHPLHSTLG